jgi:hypothetical protein
MKINIFEYIVMRKMIFLSEKPPKKKLCYKGKFMEQIQKLSIKHYCKILIQNLSRRFNKRLKKTWRIKRIVYSYLMSVDAIDQTICPEVLGMTNCSIACGQYLNIFTVVFDR